MNPEHRTWTQALELLERDLDDAVRLLERGVDPTHDPRALLWRPPVVRGQLPDDLLERAQRLVERQELVRAQLERAAATAKAELDGSPYPHASQPMGLPAYFDVSA